MLSILFFILKLIGIILASILGILIVLLLIVLFVPIRYRIDGMKYDTISLEAKIGWLLRILYCHILYDDNKLSITFRILGKLCYDNNNEREHVNPRDKKVKKRKKKNKVSKNKAKSKNETSVKMIPKENNTKTISKEINTKTISNDEVSKLIDTESSMESDGCVNSDSSLEMNDRMYSGSRNDYDKTNDTNTNKLDSKDVPEDNHKSKRKKRKTKHFLRKLKQILDKIKHFFIQLKEKIVSIINFIKNIKSKITSLLNKWEKIKAFFNNETNRAGIKKIWISVKKLVRHIYPTKLKMEVEYGTGDPCDTGQALGVAAVFYGYYGKSIKIIPNFETEILEGTLHCKGRIRLFTLLIISIKLILDKNFRILIQNFNSIKEEL